MNLGNLVPIAEVVGALSVSLTLVVLIVSIRQNTKIQKAVAVDSLAAAIAAINVPAIESHKLGSAIVKATTDWGLASREERIVAHFFLFSLFKLSENAWYQQKHEGAVYAKKKLGHDEGHTLMFLAMAAFYDPDPKSSLGFHLPMDLETGEIDAQRWSRWLRHDPVHLIERATVQHQLRSLKGIYFDCGFKDQYFLHYGARILRRRLRELGIPHHYQEFDDNHSSVDYRMDVSLPWLYRRLMGKRRG